MHAAGVHNSSSGLVTASLVLVLMLVVTAVATGCRAGDPDGEKLTTAEVAGTYALTSSDRDDVGLGSAVRLEADGDYVWYGPGDLVPPQPISTGAFTIDDDLLTLTDDAGAVQRARVRGDDLLPLDGPFGSEGDVYTR